MLKKKKRLETSLDFTLERAKNCMWKYLEACKYEDNFNEQWNFLGKAMVTKEEVKYNKEKLNYHGKWDQHPLKTISIFLLLWKRFKSEPEKENIHKSEYT